MRVSRGISSSHTQSSARQQTTEDTTMNGNPQSPRPIHGARSRQSTGSIHDIVYLTGLLFLGSVLAPSPAHAYLDPLSGSVIIQVVAASALAVAYTARQSLRHLLSVMRQFFSRRKPS